MANSILQIKNPVAREDNITNIQYHTYTPYTSSYNNNDEVRIVIQAQDLYVLPSESYLHIEFTIAPTVPGAAVNGTFAHNFISHLFSELRYEINGFEIDRCKSPGVTSQLKCMLATKLSDITSYQLYTLNSESAMNAGIFRMILPLRFVFGFCDDYNKIILNSKHELILVRNRSDINAYVAAEANVNFTVNKIHWKIQHVSLSDATKLVMLKTLDRNDDIPLAYRSWDLYELPMIPQSTRHNWSVKTTTQMSKPRYVVVGFQTNKNYVVAGNVSRFDNCNISDVKLYMNNERYPYDNLNLIFGENSFHELYHMFQNIQHSYYNNTASYNPFAITFADFAASPLFAFDCSRSDETVKTGMVDVRLEILARVNIPANTSAFCLIIHDNLVWYSPFSSLVHRDV